MVDVSVRQSKNDVHMAIVQFVARRSYVLSQPWYIEGLRIEAPHGTTVHGVNAAGKMAAGSSRRRENKSSGGWWASMWDLPRCPRIEVELSRRRSQTRVKIKLSNHPDSVLLAFELQAFLLDDRAYENPCPPMCPSCGRPLPHRPQ